MQYTVTTPRSRSLTLWPLLVAFTLPACATSAGPTTVGGAEASNAGSDETASAEPERSPGMRTVTAASEGVMGEPWDLRGELPPDAEAVEFGEEDWLGEVLNVRSRGNGTVLRLRVWTTGDGTVDDIGDPNYVVAGIALEVMENPNGSTISWTVDDADPRHPHLTIEVAWRQGQSDMGLRLDGIIDPAQGTVFVED